MSPLHTYISQYTPVYSRTTVVITFSNRPSHCCCCCVACDWWSHWASREWPKSPIFAHGRPTASYVMKMFWGWTQQWQDRLSNEHKTRIHTCLAAVTSTLNSWPRGRNLTQTFQRRTSILKVNVPCQGTRNSEPQQDTQKFVFFAPVTLTLIQWPWSDDLDQMTLIRWPWWLW